MNRRRFTFGALMASLVALFPAKLLAQKEQRDWRSEIPVMIAVPGYDINLRFMRQGSELTITMPFEGCEKRIERLARHPILSQVVHRMSEDALKYREIRVADF